MFKQIFESVNIHETYKHNQLVIGDFRHLLSAKQGDLTILDIKKENKIKFQRKIVAFYV